MQDLVGARRVGELDRALGGKPHDRDRRLLDRGQGPDAGADRDPVEDGEEGVEQDEVDVEPAGQGQGLDPVGRLHHLHRAHVQGLAQERAGGGVAGGDEEGGGSGAGALIGRGAGRDCGPSRGGLDFRAWAFVSRRRACPDLDLKTKLLLMMLSLLALSGASLFFLHLLSERRLISQVRDYTEELSTAIDIAQQQPARGRSQGRAEGLYGEAAQARGQGRDPDRRGRRDPGLDQPRRSWASAWSRRRSRGEEYVIRGVLGDSPARECPRGPRP